MGPLISRITGAAAVWVLPAAGDQPALLHATPPPVISLDDDVCDRTTTLAHCSSSKLTAFQHPQTTSRCDLSQPTSPSPALDPGPPQMARHQTMEPFSFASSDAVEYPVTIRL